MYIPEHFRIHQTGELHRIIQQHALGVLVTQHDTLDANHLPFLLDAKTGPLGTLSAHIARNNPLRTAPNGSQVLVVFRGEHGYISPNYYPSKHESPRHVPTWNYEAVHVRGILNVRDDPKFIRAVIGKLTKLHEANQPNPWKMSDAPVDYLETMVKGVVGLEIQITHVEGKAKLSQNRESRDQQGVVDGLRLSGHDALATVTAYTNRLV